MLFASAFQTWQIVGDGSGGREEGGGEGHSILPFSASSHEAGGGEDGRKNTLHHQGELEKIFKDPQLACSA